MIAYLREEDRLWEIPEGESSVGRGVDCSFPLDAARYPQISRSHAKLILRNGILTFRDENSANGTLKNGVRLSSGELRVGDTLELGAGGPVFEIRQALEATPDMSTRLANFSSDRASSPSQEVTTVMVSRGLDGVARVVPAAPKPEGATRLMPTAEPSYAQDGATRMMPSVGSAAASSRTSSPGISSYGAGSSATTSSGTSSPARTQLYQRSEERAVVPEPPEEADDEHVFVPMPVRAPQYTAREDSDAELAIQRKLGVLQSMLTATIVAAVVLVGLLLYQDREIEQNRDAILALQRQANSSVSLLMPELDQRMKKLDDKLDSIDPKLQAAEDKMVERMNREMPAMMDKYMNQRMGTLQAQHPELADPNALAGAAGALKQKP